MIPRALVIAVLIGSITAPASAQFLGDTNVPSQSTVFFSGTVVLEDSSAPPSTVLVQQVCNGSVLRSVSTDAQGRFTIKVDGSSDKGLSDASQAPPQPADVNKPLGNASQYSEPVTSSLRDCELKAVLAGFRSDRVAMDVKDTLDNARVGSIILHPISRAGGFTISATTLEAPARARKAYEKGLAAMKAQKWGNAAGEFTAAVKGYPKFAAAWYELGLAHQNRNELVEAEKAWRESINSDPKYVKPYESLVALAYRQGNWVDLEAYSTRWLQLDSEDFPTAYLFNAFAKAKENKMDKAEQVARRGLAVDKEHAAPKLNYVLAIILMQRHEYAEAAQSLRNYLTLVPDASDAPAIRRQLVQLDAAASAAH